MVYQGVTSAPLTYNVVSTAPGIYTLNESGTGPGAILNQNYSRQRSQQSGHDRIGGRGLHDRRGSSTPASTTGGVAPTNGTGLNKPILPVTATIGGVTAPVQYYGSAPGIVYGVMQVNITIPAGLSAGSQPIVISVGTAPTQSGVTISVQATSASEPQ